MGKFLSAALLTVVLVVASRATDFPLGTAFFTQNATLATFASPNTNSTSTGIFVEQSNIHAIQVTISTNLVSSATFVVDGSLDNTNWVPLTVTNSIANTGGSTLFTYSGIISYVRLRNVIGTNAVGSALYLGGQ